MDEDQWMYESIIPEEVKQNVEIKAVKKTMVGERGGKKGAVFKGRVIAAKAMRRRRNSAESASAKGRRVRIHERRTRTRQSSRMRRALEKTAKMSLLCLRMALAFSAFKRNSSIV